MMEIPENKETQEDEAKVEAAVAQVVEKLKSSDEVWLAWTEYPRWVASEVAKRFLEKGYHARSCNHMRGDGPSWFWYGICISKHPARDINMRKSRSTILG